MAILARAALPIGLLAAGNMTCGAARDAIRRGSFIVRGARFGMLAPGAVPHELQHTHIGWGE